MLVDPSKSAVNTAVTGAISQASQTTGTSFRYLLATAQVESGLNPNAGAATSSARGLFQFIEQTWLATLKQSGNALGYGRYADAITETAPGKYQISDPALRREILNLRSNPTANAVMAGAFTRSNADILRQRLGRSPSEGELYIAHFLGVGGAARLIQLAASNPNARASHYFSHAAQANSPIFYDRSGTPRSVAQVRDVLTARYDVARSSQQDPALLAQATAATPAAARSARTLRAPDTAGIANAFAAASNQQATSAAPASTTVPAATAATAVPGTDKVADALPATTPATTRPDHRPQQAFLGLFADANRSATLAPLVGALWGVPDVGAAQAQSLASGGLLDLFKDLPKGS